MPRWTCDICCDEFCDFTSVHIHRSPVCVQCVRTMFQKALDFEHEYPVQWGGDELHPSQFTHILQADFIAAYEKKEVEYKTPPAKRVYCLHVLMKSAGGRPTTEACGKFLGVRARRVAANQLMLGRCADCDNMTCMVCDGFSGDAVAIFRHQCPGRSLANEERARAFAGLKRGKDWQQCPNRTCGRRIELSEACNHMECQCGTGFCFICGKEADGEDDHWVRGGCPRYNQPGDRDVEYDDDHGYDEEDEDHGDPVNDIQNLFDEQNNEDIPPPPAGPPPPGTLEVAAASEPIDHTHPTDDNTAPPRIQPWAEFEAELVPFTHVEIPNETARSTANDDDDNAETLAEETASNIPNETRPKSLAELLAESAASGYAVSVGGVSVTEDEVDADRVLWAQFASWRLNRTG